MKFQTLLVSIAWVSLTVLRAAAPAAAGGYPPPRPQDAEPTALHATRIILLGTGGGPVARARRSQPASLLVVDGTPYLIDAGDGVVRQLKLAGYDPQQISRIFITHYHLDHYAGVEPLLGFIWVNRNEITLKAPPVEIYGPPATQFIVDAALRYLSVTDRIFNANGSMMPMKPMFEARDILHDGTFYHDGLIRVTAVENTHYHLKPGSAAYLAGDKSYSYRFDTPNGSVVFTGDTGPSAAVTRLATRADVLVSEVVDEEALARYMQSTMHLTPQLARVVAFHMQNEHLTPADVGKMAARAHVGMVILHHFGPGLDSETDTSGYTAGVKQHYSGPVIAGRDLLEYDLYPRAR